jgi:hypothetical protein
MIKVEQFIDTDQLKRDMTYSLSNLSDAMMTQASLFAHYGVLSSKASKQVDNIKLLLENAEARVYRILRDEAVTAGEKKTEVQLEKAVAIDSRVITYKRSLNEARQVEIITKIAVESFRHRRDMLIQQGLLSREEMKGNLTIAERNRSNDSVEDLKKRTIDRLTNST